MRASRRAPQALLLPLDPESATPLYRQLYDSLREAILSGRIAAGARLPSSRLLAAELRVSRNTVMLAFDQLVAEGYLEGAPRSGTRVPLELPGRHPRVRPRSRSAGPGLSERGRLIAETPVHMRAGGTVPRPFRAGVPALDQFPRALWARLCARRWRTASALGYGEVGGYGPLREAIADYVRAGRGARCSVDQVIVVNGSQQGVDLAARVLLDPGDVVWMEDPGYNGARVALLAAGARPVPVPVDFEGLVVDRGRELAPRARMAYVSPSHQFPLGVTMAAGRRLALLRWAAQAHAWVLEDDYDSEFRYDARPLACLQGMDEDGRVIYVGTFSKTLAPALRLGYLIVPEPLIDAFRAARAAADRHSPTMDQAVLADFLTEGHFARHVRRMRRLYAERQEALVAAVRERLDGVLEVRPSAAGMHLVGWLPEGVSDEEAAGRAAAAGVETAALSRYALHPPARGGLLMGWAGYEPAEMREAVGILARVLR
ncbi:MAG TPA: PLP-dependent aminotransferase family protein [Gemmatimonadales bacterium]